MEAVSIYGAKARFSQLVDKAAAGEDVIVSRHGKPIVRITRLAEPRPRVRLGVLAGRVRVGDDFDAPLPVEVMAAFEGR
jgi:prevent-host-death family protein